MELSFWSMTMSSPMLTKVWKKGRSAWGTLWRQLAQTPAPDLGVNLRRPTSGLVGDLLQVPGEIEDPALRVKVSIGILGDATPVLAVHAQVQVEEGHGLVGLQDAVVHVESLPQRHPAAGLGQVDPVDDIDGRGSLGKDKAAGGRRRRLAVVRLRWR